MTKRSEFENDYNWLQKCTLKLSEIHTFFNISLLFSTRIFTLLHTNNTKNGAYTYINNNKTLQRKIHSTNTKLPNRSQRKAKPNCLLKWKVSKYEIYVYIHTHTCDLQNLATGMVLMWIFISWYCNMYFYRHSPDVNGLDYNKFSTLSNWTITHVVNTTGA